MNSNGRPLFDQAREILNDLGDCGWYEVFQQHGIDIRADDLKSELLRPQSKIDRQKPGFEDFAANGMRGIEPGNPAQSLLFHGFASPHVTSYIKNHAAHEVTRYPTPRDIEVLENLVYGIQPFSLEDVRARVYGAHLAIVVYAKEYRVANDTVHRRHADMCYSRTGISRVGTADAHYLTNVRGYMPENDQNEKQIRVLPCRYGAYIAALVSGDQASHGPMRFITRVSEYDENLEQELNVSLTKSAGTTPSTVLSSDQNRARTDTNRRFWIPVHKIFSGQECLLEYDLDVQLTANHLNEKLRRVHLMFGRLGHDGGWHEPELSKPPFRFTEGIAEFSQAETDGPGLLMPVVHESLVRIATHKEAHGLTEQTTTFLVPNSEVIGTGMFSSSIYIPSSSGGARFAPEYVHARFAVDYDCTLGDCL